MSDCGKCKMCKNKVKFGGDGRMKQACSLKICNNRKIVGEKLNEQRKKVGVIKPSHGSNKIGVKFKLAEVMIKDLKAAHVSDQSEGTNEFGEGGQDTSYEDMSLNGKTRLFRNPLF